MRIIDREMLKVASRHITDEGGGGGTFEGGRAAVLPRPADTVDNFTFVNEFEWTGSHGKAGRIGEFRLVGIRGFHVAHKEKLAGHECSFRESVKNGRLATSVSVLNRETGERGGGVGKILKFDKFAGVS